MRARASRPSSRARSPERPQPVHTSPRHPPPHRPTRKSAQRLLGERVIEISALILERLTAQSSFAWPAYEEFVRANSDFMARTEQRAVRYWDCYYRDRCTRGEYPVIVALNRLRKGA